MIDIVNGPWLGYASQPKLKIHQTSGELRYTMWCAGKKSDIYGAFSSKVYEETWIKKSKQKKNSIEATHRYGVGRTCKTNLKKLDLTS